LYAWHGLGVVGRVDAQVAEHAEFSIKPMPDGAPTVGVDTGSTRLRAYNPGMLHTLNSLVGTAAMENLTLLINHVLASEPVATKRLAAHTGRCIQLQFSGWPSLLPPLPATSFRVSPAGLIEWCGSDAVVSDPDLRVTIDASNPALSVAQALSGTRPKVDVSGDAAFATDLNWLIDNLRWDMQDDLARVAGQAPAREIARIAGGIANGMREAVRTLSGLVARDRNEPAEPPAR
jgi:ubiquinone biosynthesis protein UbiJ